MFNNSILNFKKRPYAFAKIKGSSEYPHINGIAYFYKVKAGVLGSLQLEGLPVSDDICQKPIFAVHIHSGGSCTGNSTDPFADAMTHYNPNNCNHPYHAGDLPPIFGANGIGFSAFLTNMKGRGILRLTFFFLHAIIIKYISVKERIFYASG